MLEHQKDIRRFCIGTAVLMILAGFLMNSPSEIAQGLWKILTSRDTLITDYFALANYGAAFINAGCVLLFSIGLIDGTKIPYTGLTLAALFINAGFGFWGKNPVNVIPIVLGTRLYAMRQGMPFGRYVYTALFATCLAPFFTELIYILPFSFGVNLLIGAATGLFIGYVMPPLSMHTASMHMGYSLFNVGFSAGILAFIMYCVLRAFGIQTETVLIWQTEVHPAITIGTLVYFAATFFYGLWLEKGNIKGLKKIFRHPGKAVSDFILMDGAGNTFMNMGLMGFVAELYILFIGGQVSGPVLGSILTLFGFSAFGAHLKNYLPVLAGVVLAGFFMIYDLHSPALLIAAMFVVGVSPISGQFGPFAGLVAGALHVAIVMCTAPLYGGLNLYNNGFSAGWVAILMVPLAESFMHHFEIRKQKRKNKKG